MSERPGFTAIPEVIPDFGSFSFLFRVKPEVEARGLKLPKMKKRYFQSELNSKGMTKTSCCQEIFISGILCDTNKERKGSFFSRKYY